MIVSQLQIYNFRRFRSVDGKPGLSIIFHEGLNALIGENDSGKTAIIDALKLYKLLWKDKSKNSPYHKLRYFIKYNVKKWFWTI